MHNQQLLPNLFYILMLITCVVPKKIQKHNLPCGFKKIVTSQHSFRPIMQDFKNLNSFSKKIQ